MTTFNFMPSEDLLSERGKTHGDFEHNASVSQDIKRLLRSCGNWSLLGPSHQEALDMIAHKIGRIMAGDWTHQDHWDDIEGYAKLAAEKNQKMVAELAAKSDFVKKFENENG